MNLIVDQMMQLEHIHDTDCHLVVKGITGQAIIQCCLPYFVKPCFNQMGTDLIF